MENFELKYIIPIVGVIFSNFIEFAILQYLTSSQFVENDEMTEILKDKELVKNLMDGLEDFKKGDYTIV